MILPHCGSDKMAEMLQITFPNPSSCMKTSQSTSNYTKLVFPFNHTRAQAHAHAIYSNTKVSQMGCRKLSKAAQLLMNMKANHTRTFVWVRYVLIFAAENHVGLNPSSINFVVLGNPSVTCRYRACQCPGTWWSALGYQQAQCWRKGMLPQSAK